MKEGLEKLGVPPIQNLRVVRPGDASIVPVNDSLTWAQYVSSLFLSRRRPYSWLPADGAPALSTQSLPYLRNPEDQRQGSPPSQAGEWQVHKGVHLLLRECPFVWPASLVVHPSLDADMLATSSLGAQTMWEVKGHEEFAYERRPLGADIHDVGGPNAKNWLEVVGSTRGAAAACRSSAVT